MRKWVVMREKAKWKVQVCTGKNSSCDEVYSSVHDWKNWYV